MSRASENLDACMLKRYQKSQNVLEQIEKLTIFKFNIV